MMIMCVTSTVFAQSVPTQTHSIWSISCDGGVFPAIYYEGASSFLLDEFQWSTNLQWTFNQAWSNSYVSIANPLSMIGVPSFSWSSQWKPDGVSNVVAMSSSQMTVTNSVPNNYSRSQIAAQVVYHLKRTWYATPGPISPTIYYMPVWWTTQTQQLNHAPVPSSGPTVDNECYNIHVWFCGDGIVDDTWPLRAEWNINISLGWWEQCDDGNNNNNDGCTNDCISVPLCPAWTDNAWNVPMTPWASCDDGDPTTENDVWDSTWCNCAWTTILCPAWTDNAWNLPATPWTSCNDGDPTTINDVWNASWCDCSGTQVNAPVCGEKDGWYMYDFDNSGDSLDPVIDAVWLCPVWTTVVNFNYNQSLHIWTWQCEDAYGLLSPECSTAEQWCGDGIPNWWELCDDGNTINGDGCDNNCTNTPLCPVWTDNAGNVPETPWSSCDDGDPTTINDTWGISWCDCSGNQINGPVCWEKDGWYMYDFDNAGDGLHPIIDEAWLCPAWTTVANFVYNQSLHIWTWQCVDTYWQLSPVCSAAEQWCGDGIVQWGEVCDDGNSNNNDACKNNCQIPTATPVCGEKDGWTLYDFDNAGDGLDPVLMADRLCPIGYTVINFGYDDIQHIWTWNCEWAWGISPECSTQEQWCGDGIPNGWELCDDGNYNNNDACKNNCQPPLGNPECGEKNWWTMYDFDNSGDGLDEVDDALRLCPVGQTVENFFYNSATHTWTWQCKKWWWLSPICSATEQWCGDGIIQNTEQCDGWVDCNLDCTIDDGPSSTCELLDVTVPNGEIPFTSTFSCQWEGNNYEIVLYDEDGFLIQSWNTAFASYTFETVGVYSVQCFVDGQAWTTCDDTSSPILPWDTLDEYINGQYYSETTAFVSSFLATINFADVSPASLYDAVTLWPLYEQILTSYHTIASSVATNCYDTCKWIVVAQEPEGPLCEIDLQPDQTIYNTNNQTIEVTCSIPWSDIGDIRIDCDNGDDIIIGDVWVCNYDSYGSYVPRCFSADQSCDAAITLRTEWCTNCWWDNYCGDGDWHPELGEECDDGNIDNGDGCSSNCQLEWECESCGWDNFCGDGVVQNGEMCDDGDRNGFTSSICSTNCEIIKWFDPATCEFVDPPSIQMWEYLPFRWGIEQDVWIEDNVNCEAWSNEYGNIWWATQDIGKIEKDSMVCHFVITAPNGETFSMEKPCFADEFTSTNVEWYRDFLSDKNLTLEEERWTSYLDTAEIEAAFNEKTVYGEYTIELVKVDYDICLWEWTIVTETDIDGNEYEYIETTMDGMKSLSYDGRICQFNFAVTSPYMVQKWISLSSTEDDIDTLKRFLDINGDNVLDGAQLVPIDTFSTVDARSVLQTSFDAYQSRASEYVNDVSNDVAASSILVKKVPGQEIYLATDRVTIASTSSEKPFNDGKATTILVDNGADVVIEWSLYGNILILNPEWSVTFTNLDCDEQDKVQGIFLANDFKTNHEVYWSMYGAIENTSLDKAVWCDGWGLVVEGILMWGGEQSTRNLTTSRRSTLVNWFDSGTLRDKQIFDGAALRIQWSIGVWDNLPPLAKDLVDALRIQK